jgi:hypothetical protein
MAAGKCRPRHIVPRTPSTLTYALGAHDHGCAAQGVGTARELNVTPFLIAVKAAYY